MIDWTIDEAGVATLTLDRPVARNALPLTAWTAIADAVEAIDQAAARVLVLRSAVDGIFSAGADIAEFALLQRDAMARARFRESMRAGIDSLAKLSIPTVAAIDGGCFGAAVALVLACDLRVAGVAARFAITPAKLGIGYPKEDIARLIAHIGRGQASRMLFSAAPIDADEAVRIGLAEIGAPDAAVEAGRLARAIAAHDPGAVAMLKRTLADPADPRHDADFDAAFGGDAFAKAFTTFGAGKTR